MARMFQQLALLGTIVSIAAILLGTAACVKRTQLALPLPLALPVLNVILPISSIIIAALARKHLAAIQNKVIRAAIPYLAYGMTLMPFILFVLSAIYATPNDLQSCAADQQWLRMFENKDASSIRGIQSQLQCCGYNSMHDRAWPFPARNIDARACERTQGYTIACGDSWRYQENLAAILTALASLLNWLVTVSREKCTGSS